MSPEALSRRTILFVNVAHALDHFVILIYPTAVIAMAVEFGLTYASLITLSTGTFLAFGVLSLPMGWLAERFGRRNMLAAFFAGCGLSLVGLSMASTPLALGVGLFVLGAFSAIYHPIGSAMLVSNARRLGRDLGWNGVWGNLGAGFASGVTAAVAAWFGWRAAFALPGVTCLAVALVFVACVPGDGDAQGANPSARPAATASRPMMLLAIFAVAIVAGGMTFNVTTISLPKVIDERLGLDLPLGLIGSLATAVFVVGALTQLLVGRLVDRLPLSTIFIGLAFTQTAGLALAAANTGAPLLAGLALTMAGIYGQVIVNDAMVAQYVPPHLRAKAFSLRYFLGFTVSGFAAPLIAFAHSHGGFPMVLGLTAALAAVVLTAAVGFAAASGRDPRTAS